MKSKRDWGGVEVERIYTSIREWIFNLQLKCYLLDFKRIMTLPFYVVGDQDFLPVIERIKDLEMFVYVVAFEVSAQ